jgi:hypothetical protein
MSESETWLASSAGSRRASDTNNLRLIEFLEVALISGLSNWLAVRGRCDTEFAPYRLVPGEVTKTLPFRYVTDSLG